MPLFASYQRIRLTPKVSHFKCEAILTLPITEKSLTLPDPEIWRLPKYFNSEQDGTEGYLWDIYLHFFTTALSKVSGQVPIISKNRKFVTTRNLSILPHLPFWTFVTYPHFLGGGSQTSFQQLQIIATQFQAWNYLTCYTESELSFQFYTDPFQLSGWIYIISTMTLFTILTDLFLAKKLKKIETHTSAFFYLGAFFEETSSISGKLLNSSVFRIGVGPWLLLCSILSNVYVSLILRGLNVPPPPIHFNTWASLFPPANLLSNENKTTDDWFAIYNDMSNPDLASFRGFSFLSPQKIGNAHEIYQKTNYIWYLALKELFLSVMNEPSLSPFHKFVLSLASPTFRWYPKSLHENGSWILDSRNWNHVISHRALKSAIEEEIVDCGKSLFVQSQSELVRYRHHLGKEYPFISTYLGSNPILGQFYGLIFHCSRDSKVLKYFKSWFESGVYNFYAENYIANKTLQLEHPVSKEIKKSKFKSGVDWNPVKKLGLTTSISTLFLILIGMLGLGGLVFLGENLKSRQRQIVLQYGGKLCCARIRNRAILSKWSCKW